MDLLEEGPDWESLRPLEAGVPPQGIAGLWPLSLLGHEGSSFLRSAAWHTHLRPETMGASAHRAQPVKLWWEHALSLHKSVLSVVSLQ